MQTLHDMITAQMGWWANLCWWIGWKLWPFRCFSRVREWGTRQWSRDRARRHEEAARLLLASGWHGGYCVVDGKPYTLRVYEGHKGGAE
jgi:hypothetical protein